MKFVVGFGMGMSVVYHLGERLVFAIPFAVVGIVAQLVFARMMSLFLGGADPVATYGAKNLQELRARIEIPAIIVFFDFFAKVSLYAAVVIVLQVVFW